MVRKPKGKRNHGHGWIIEAVGRKYRTSRNKEIGYSVNPTVRVDHSLPRIRVHPSRAHMMVGIAGVFRRFGADSAWIQVQPAEAVAAEFLCQKLMRAP